MRLALFFSRGMSLAGWQRAGILERELSLYRGLLPHLESLVFVTYGGDEDVAIAAGIPGVHVLTNRYGLPPNVYSIIAPWLHRQALAEATVYKTTQINGAWTATIAKRIFRKRLLVRCGFLWADFMARLDAGSWRAVVAKRIEWRVMRCADSVIVASESDRQVLLDRYDLSSVPIHVIPNFVDTDLFRPLPDVPKKPGRVIFVGRLEEQKNVAALIVAAEGLPGIGLTVVGDGPLRNELESLASRCLVDVEFLGRLPQTELPELINRSTLFVLPSLYEGNPKALLEAMGCGTPVIGTRVPGIQEVLVHKKTGYLCGTSADDIRNALVALLDNDNLRTQIARAAETEVRERYSLPGVLGRHLEVLRQIGA